MKSEDLSAVAMGLDTIPGTADDSGMKKPKHPPHADLSQLAKSIVDSATDETEEQPETPAVKRGRLGGAKGGAARAQKLTAEERAEIAKKAAAKRWGR